MKILRLLAFLVVLGCGSSQPAADSADGGGDASPSTLSDKITVASVDAYQSVQVLLVKDGASVTPNAPIIAGRAALLRVGVGLQGTRWRTRKLDAELHLSAGGREVAVLKDSKSITRASLASDLSSTFNFKVDADNVRPDMSYFIVVSDPALPAAGAAASSLTYPSDGTLLALGASAAAAQMKIKIVPVLYQFSASATPDGGLDAAPPSGVSLLPDTTAEQLQLYHDTLFKMYPTARIDVSLHAPLPWTKEIAPDGTGWDDLIVGVMDLRAKDREADDVFYVGVFVATRSMREFCSMGCVLGVAQLSTPGDVSARMAIVAGYPGSVGPDTLNQELGHALGREHAECGGADRPDRAFPYPNAGIGVWGYDQLQDSLIDPGGSFHDFMGYCQPIWISDYTYSALFKRISFVNKQKEVRGPLRSYRAIHVRPDGSLRWGDEVTLSSEPEGEPRDVSLLTSTGIEAQRVRGHFYKHDTIGGGFVLVPGVDPGVARVRVKTPTASLEVARP